MCASLYRAFLSFSVIGILSALSFASDVAASSPYFTYTCDRTFYVATTGNDANPGTQGSPYLTVNRAVETIGLTGGDCIEVAPGTYTGQIWWSANGTDDSDDGYIVLYSEVPHEAKLRMDSGYSLVNMSGDYGIIDGFDIVADGGHAVDLEGNHHAKVLNNIVHDSGGSGIGAARGEYYQFEGNIAFNNARTNTYQTSGISIYQARGVSGDVTPDVVRNIIRNNITFNNYTTNLGYEHTDGNGIIIDDFQHTQIGGFPIYPYPTLVENNLSFNNGGKGIQVVWSNYVTVRNNTVYHNNKDPFNYGTWRGDINNHDSSNNTFVNNISVANPATNANNTAIGNMAGGVYVSSNVVWSNNLTFNGTDGEDSVKTEGSVDIPSPANNLFGVDPEFASPGLTLGADFRLLPGSPAIGAGTSTYGYAALDLSGAARNPLAIDLGAGPDGPDTEDPTAPTLALGVVAPVLVNLSWTESTDNTGIFEYEVERCAGAGCSSYALIATTSATNFTSAVSPETTYRFRVRAEDVAQNFSSYSSALSTTTPELVIGTSTETIWGTTTPSNTNAEDSDDYELGTIFSPLVDGTVTGVRLYVADDESGLHTARIWDNDDDEVIGGPYTFSIGTPGWYTYDLSTPVELEAGETYTVAISTGADSGKAYAISSGALASAGWNSSLLTYPASAGVYATTLGNRPTATYQSSNYFRDIEFLPTATTYTLSYSAGSNASLTGSSSQVVVAGGSGSAVTVVPNSGYSFVRWSDSVTSNPRTDTSVSANLSVTAVLEAVSSGGGGGGGGGGGSSRNKKVATSTESVVTPTEATSSYSAEQQRLLQLIALLKQLLALYVTLLSLKTGAV